MWKRLLSNITHNFALKLGSVIIAVFVWYLAVYYSDPQETQSFSVRVEVTNESYIANGKQVYYIDDEYKSVTVYVTANSSTLKRINSSNLSVTADLTQIVDFDRTPVMVPLSASCSAASDVTISLSKSAIPIEIEDVASKDLPITVLTGDTSPDKDYEIGSMTPSVESITVSGPESVISTIDSVVAYVDVTNMSEDATVTGRLSFIDKDQNEISQDIIDDDVTIVDNISNITVNIELWQKQSGVKFNINYSGEPAEGYMVYDITTSPDEITVAGSEDALKKLAANNYMIDISADKIDISNANKDVSVDVVLTDLLPENIKVASSMNQYVTVNFTILPIDSREFKFDVDRIQTQNLAENLSVSYTQTNLTIKVRASSGYSLDNLTTDSISAYINLANYTAGESSVPVSVVLPEGYELVEQPTIDVTIKEKVKEATN